MKNNIMTLASAMMLIHAMCRLNAKFARTGLNVKFSHGCVISPGYGGTD